MRSPRATARRKVTYDLRRVRENIELLRVWWNAPTKIYEITPKTYHARERQLHEYPETQRHYWAQTIYKIDETIEMLEELRKHCVIEHEKTPEV